MMIGLISVIGLNLNPAANALVLVDGYYKSNGTYVESHYRTNPDGIYSPENFCLFYWSNLLE